MSIAAHPNGYCLVKTGPGGTGGSLSVLGYTRDGVSLTLQAMTDGIIADNGGPQIPIDYQRFGVMGRLSLPMMVFDWDVVESLMMQHFGAALGQEPIAGTVLALNALTFRVVLTSPLDGKVWRFRHCVWPDMAKVLSTRAEPLNMNLICFPAVQTSTLDASVLFDRVDA